MPETWPLVRIADLAATSPNALATGPFGSAVASKNFRDSGVPLIRGSNLSLDPGIRLDEGAFVYLDEETAAKFSRSQVIQGDLVFTCWGTVGQVGFIGPGSQHARYIVSNKQMKLTPDTAMADPLFLYYALSSPASVKGVTDSGIGSSVPGFNLGQLKDVRVCLPPLVVQRAIAEVLDSLDERIAANRDVADRADMLAAAHAQSVGAAVPLKLLAKLVRKSVNPSTLGEDRVDHYSLPAYDASRLPAAVPASTIKSGKFAIEQPSVLVSKLNPHISRTWMAIPVTRLALASTEYLVLVPQPSLAPEVLFAACCQDSFTSQLRGGATGTTGSHQRVRPADIMTMEVPDVTQLDALTADTIVSLVQLAVARRRESVLLADMRDTLLPKLISGELQVRDAEEIAEVAS